MTQGALAKISPPGEWGWERLWSAAPRVQLVGQPDAEPLSVFLQTGVIPRSSREDNHNQLGEDLSKYQVVRPGDLVFNKLRTWQGGLGVSSHHGIVSPAYFVCHPNGDWHPRYLHYLLLSTPYLAELTRLSKFMPPSQFDIPWDTLRTLPLLRPPLHKQRHIAEFLDAEVDRIDQLTVLQQTVRSSVEARTLAHLDLKIDELTDKYGTISFRRMIWSVEQGVSPQCDNFAASPETWGVLKVSAVKHGTFFQEENKQLPADIQPERRYEIKSGDLLITRANTPQLVGATAVAESPRPKLMLCDKIFRVVTTSDLLPEFLVLVSLGTKIRVMCAEASHGTSQSMANLKTEEIKQWPIPAVPIAIQRAFIAELSAAREHAATLVEAIDTQLALLAERRKALITAAVTGGISV